MALSRVVSEIFNVEKCRDLEIGVRGHSRSSKVLSLDRSCNPGFKVTVLTSQISQKLVPVPVLGTKLLKNTNRN